jgi:hypothetical protein
MPKHNEREAVMAYSRPTEYRRMSDTELMQRVLVVLNHKRKWCQGSNALNASGLPVSPLSDEAVSWCLRGACIKVLNPDHSVLVRELHEERSDISMQIARACGFDTPSKGVQWNDTQGRTWVDVVERVQRRVSESASTRSKSK